MLTTHVPDRLRNRSGEIGVRVQHPGKRSVQLDVMKARMRTGEGAADRSDLVDDIRVCIRGRDRHRPAPEAEEIGQTGMRPDGDAVLGGEPHRLDQRDRIAAVESTGNVRARDQRHQAGIVTEAPVSEALAHVAVDVKCAGHHLFVKHLDL